MKSPPLTRRCKAEYDVLRAGVFFVISSMLRVIVPLQSTAQSSSIHLVHS